MDQGTGMAGRRHLSPMQRLIKQSCTAATAIAVAMPIKVAASYALKSLNKTGEHETPRLLINKHDYFIVVLVSVTGFLPSS